MEKKDLMIGDWVQYTQNYYTEKKGTWSEVHYGRVCSVGLLYIKVDRGNVAIEPEIVKPIPLTAEILEKNGFKIDKNETYCKRYFFACNLGKVPQTVVEFSFYGEGVLADTLFKCWAKPESCDGENSIHICDLKSVHELQHALRLCGIEKEIEL